MIASFAYLAFWVLFFCDHTRWCPVSFNSFLVPLPFMAQGLVIPLKGDKDIRLSSTFWIRRLDIAYHYSPCLPFLGAWTHLATLGRAGLPVSVIMGI